MSNLKVWDAVSSVPKEFLKEITGGRLRGMSNIDPVWRLKTFTEQFGMVGVGWTFEILETKNETLGNETVTTVRIALMVKIDGEWSKPVPGIGSSKIVTQERNGAFVSDEAYKMALTDALGVAMKPFGVAANIYLGKGGEDNKYNLPPTVEPTYINKTQKALILKAADNDLALIDDVLALGKVKDLDKLEASRFEGVLKFINSKKGR